MTNMAQTEESSAVTSMVQTEGHLMSVTLAPMEGGSLTDLVQMAGQLLQTVMALTVGN